MNLPNKLTMGRICAIPVFIIALMMDQRVLATCLFIAAALTDFLDGYIARKYDLVTNFGKFLDPLADKFIVFAALLGILVKYTYISGVFVWAAAIVMFRELAVTSMRLVVAIMVEPVIFPFFAENHILSYITIGIMTVMTLWSGIDYFVKYGKYITQED